jgi:hypothetical protein
VEMRTNGIVCADYGVTASWIGIEDTSSSNLAQAGMAYEYSAYWGYGVFCRFWATGLGFPNFYACGPKTPDGTYIYFDINKYRNPITNVYYYQISDCGSSGGYSNCGGGGLNSSQQAFSSSVGVALAESTDSVGCINLIMGDQTNQSKIGTASYALEGQNGSFGWAIRDFVLYPAQTCPQDYKGSVISGGGGVRTYDNRNDS